MFKDLGFGLGLRSKYYDDILSSKPDTPVQWFEAISENYFKLAGSNAGSSRKNLRRVREKFPVVLHGVNLSIGSTDPLDEVYLQEMKELISEIEPAFVSDHLCYTGVLGVNGHDLFPLPYTIEAVDHVVSRLNRVQEFYGRKILIENVSSYVEFKNSAMQEWEFLSEVVTRSGCGILLDVNNITVSSINHGFDPVDYLKGIPLESVGQIHLAGHSIQGSLRIDTHDEPVSDETWTLYARAKQMIREKTGKSVSTLVEWDAKLPEYSVLEREVLKAREGIQIHETL